MQLRRTCATHTKHQQPKADERPIPTSAAIVMEVVAAADSSRAPLVCLRTLHGAGTTTHMPHRVEDMEAVDHLSAGRLGVASGYPVDHVCAEDLLQLVYMVFRVFTMGILPALRSIYSDEFCSVAYITLVVQIDASGKRCLVSVYRTQEILSNLVRTILCHCVAVKAESLICCGGIPALRHRTNVICCRLARDSQASPATSRAAHVRVPPG